MAETAPSGERPDADLIRSLEAADIHPLWDRYQRITPIEPSATDAARIWRWRDFEPFTARAAAEEQGAQLLAAGYPRPTS